MASSNQCQGTILTTGKSCVAFAVENGFCLKHKSQTFLKEAKEKGEIACRMFDRGCRNYLSEKDNKKGVKTCETCRDTLLGKSTPCTHTGCKNKTEKDQRYCGKHARDTFREKAITNNIQYCNIDRGCVSILKPGEKKCGKCRKSKDGKITEEIKELRMAHTNCLLCKEISSTDYFCETCLPKVNAVTTFDVKRGVVEAWCDLKNGAIKRDLELTISFEVFKELAICPCAYCGQFSLSSLNGIDRYDNRKGYLSTNCVPCCSMCNIMKGDTLPKEFYDKLYAIVAFQTSGMGLQIIHPSFCSRSTPTFTAYKNSVLRKRQIAFDLTEEQFNTLRNGHCYLCGISTSDIHKNGIDRIDSSVGYTLANCRTCCGHCNHMKNIYDLPIFLEKCKQILTFWEPNHKEDDKSIAEHSSELEDEGGEEEKIEKAIYRATDIYEILQRGLPEFLLWARKANKSEQFMEGVRTIECVEKKAILEEIGHQIMLERKRGDVTEKKHIQASSMLALLMNSPKSKFIEYYSSIYDLSKCFLEKLDELCDHLALVGKAEGIELCRKFLRAENMRRKSKRNVEIRNELREPAPRSKWEAKSVINTVEFTFEKEIAPITEEKEKGKEKAQMIELVKTSVKKQWKSIDIYNDFKANNGVNYKLYCEENNAFEDVDGWERQWAQFKDKMAVGDFETNKGVITEFIENLRRVRHNKLTDKKAKKVLLDRTSRKAWPISTILFAFKQNKIEAFKLYMDEINAEKVNNWSDKWETFIQKMAILDSDSDRTDHISKFLTNMRASRYLAKDVI